MGNQEQQLPDHRPEPGTPGFIEVGFGDNGEWVAALRFVPDAKGRPALAELRVFANTDPTSRAPGKEPPGARTRPLTTVTLRELRLGRVVAEARERLLRDTEWWMNFDLHQPILDEVEPNQAPQHLGDLLDDLSTEDGRSRRVAKRDDEHHARIALLYVELGHSSTRVQQWLAAHGQDYDVSTVRRWVAEARSRRLLTKTTRGKKGGHLTETAERLVRQMRLRKV